MEIVLLIDSDKGFCENLAENLHAEGFGVEAVCDAEAGREMALNKKYSLIAMNVLGAGGDNDFSALRHIRSGTSAPILIMSARANEEDRIAGLDMGADDFLQKPFNPRELGARIRAVLRRTREGADSGDLSQPPKRLQVGDIEMELDTRVVLRSGAEIALTSAEFSILEIFLRKAGQIVSREELMRVSLGRELSPYDRSIDVHISRLRKKLGQEAIRQERIKTIRGTGYLYAHAHTPVMGPYGGGMTVKAEYTRPE